MRRQNGGTRPHRILKLGLPVLLATALDGAGLAWSAARPEPAVAAPVTVYKSPTCGCCHKWVEHMQAEGFELTVHDVADVQPVRERHRVPASLGSCHTSLVGGYAIEGHVPADVIRKLLRERPGVAGLSAPGMPSGAPGMGSGGGYDVIAFTRDGRTSVYARK